MTNPHEVIRKILDAATSDNGRLEDAIEVLNGYVGEQVGECSRFVELTKVQPIENENVIATLNGEVGTLKRGEKHYTFYGNGFVNSYTLRSENLSAIQWLCPINFQKNN